MANNEVQQTTPKDVSVQIKSEATKEKFINLFMGIHKCDKDQAERIYQNESFAFLKIREENPDLLDCSPLSTMGCFLEATNSGLSFSKAKGHVYLSYRNITVKHGQQQYKEKRMVWDPSPDGHVFLRQRVGSVQYVTTPIIVYDCDIYELTAGDKPSIVHKPKLPRPKGALVVLGYNYVVDEKGERHLFWIDADGVDRLKHYSELNNGEWQQNEKGKWKKVPGRANELYTSHNGGIDPGFFAAKIKKFSVKDWRKADLPAYLTEYMDDSDSYNEKQLPEPNVGIHYEPKMIVTPVAANGTENQNGQPANEFIPDAENDLPIIDNPSPDQQPDEPTLFNNQF